MVILVSENLAWLVITICYVSREWAVTAEQPTFDSSPLVNLASAIWPGKKAPSYDSSGRDQGWAPRRVHHTTAFVARAGHYDGVLDMRNG